MTFVFSLQGKTTEKWEMCRKDMNSCFIFAEWRETQELSDYSFMSVTHIAQVYHLPFSSLCSDNHGNLSVGLSDGLFFLDLYALLSRCHRGLTAMKDLNYNTVSLYKYGKNWRDTFKEVLLLNIQ